MLTRQARSVGLNLLPDGSTPAPSWGWWQHHPRPADPSAEHAWFVRMAGTGGVATSLTESAPGRGVLQRTVPGAPVRLDYRHPDSLEAEVEKTRTSGSSRSTDHRQDDPERPCDFCGHPWRTHGPGPNCHVERRAGDGGDRREFCRCPGFREARS